MSSFLIHRVHRVDFGHRGQPLQATTARDESRDHRDSVLPGRFPLLQDDTSEAVHVQHGLGLGAVQSGAVRDVNQQIYPPDVGSVDEVGLEQCAPDGVVTIPLAGELGQFVGLAGPRHELRSLHGDADFAGAFDCPGMAGGPVGGGGIDQGTGGRPEFEASPFDLVRDSGLVDQVCGEA